MSYPYSFEDLLALLHGRAPAKVDAVALHRRRVEHGHLSVGLKIHCLGGGSQFSTLVEGLGGAQKILDVNYYKHCHASLCLVLPPVGSARSAILLLECIEHFIGSALFSNPEIQIQVCSPGRLDARRSALLAIGFYLGSDTLRRYTLGDLATSVMCWTERALAAHDPANVIGWPSIVTSLVGSGIERLKPSPTWVVRDCFGPRVAS